jgi:cysteine-rich repeat protein
MGETCVAGACACAAGDSVCAGACVNEQTDSKNCGACGHACAAASHCAAGACAAVCGDGVREGTEQCDDGNVINLDGCDSQCRFEQDHRVTGLAIEHGTSAFCKANALGDSINTFIALGTLNGELTTAVQDATLNLLIAFLNPVADLTGTNDATVTLGVLGGTLTDAYTGAANGTNDLDWWYTPDPAAINASRVPLAQLPGKIVTHVLTAGPGSITLPINLGSGTANLQVNNTTIQSTLGAANAPTESATANPPGHLASENLNPAITSFETGGGTPGAPAGELCGDVTALSLSQIAVPAVLATGGSDACSQNFSANLATNSLLDVFVDGCNHLIQVVAPTQPDLPGGYKLTLTGNHVTGCTMGVVAVPLATCLAAVSYSAYLDFSTDRVIIR